MFLRLKMFRDKNWTFKLRSSVAALSIFTWSHSPLLETLQILFTWNQRISMEVDGCSANQLLQRRARSTWRVCLSTEVLPSPQADKIRRSSNNGFLENCPKLPVHLHSKGSAPGKNFQHLIVWNHPVFHDGLLLSEQKMVLWDLAFKKGNGNSLHSTSPNWCHNTELCWHEVWQVHQLWTDTHHSLVCDHAMDSLHE